MNRFCGIAAASLLAAVVGSGPVNQAVAAGHHAAPAKATHHSADKIRKLSGTVGPTMTISMSRSNAIAGRYKITISDMSSFHNFHFKGPGVDKHTTIPAERTVTWTLRLRPGNYHYKCDAHPTMMKGNLTVTAAP
jgi:plastocyanin